MTIYKVNKDAWWAFDPVITVHPENIFLSVSAEMSPTMVSYLAIFPCLPTRLWKVSQRVPPILTIWCFVQWVSKLRLSYHQSTCRSGWVYGANRKWRWFSGSEDWSTRLMGAWVLTDFSSDGSTVGKGASDPQDALMMRQVLRNKDTAGTRAIRFIWKRISPSRLWLSRGGLKSTVCARNIMVKMIKPFECGDVDDCLFWRDSFQ